MNTKQSVKCSCSSRIVLTEVEGGECQVMYYWKHEGHGALFDHEGWTGTDIQTRSRLKNLKLDDYPKLSMIG